MYMVTIQQDSWGRVIEVYYKNLFLDIGKQEEESKNSDNYKCPTPLLSVRNSDISGQDVDNVDTDTCPICREVEL
jgi:hypothetical protein